MATQSNQAMVSETSICNQALTWLGQKPISSLSDANTTAEWMRNNYPFIRDAVLEEQAWTFATVRASSDTEDKDGWGVLYKHPKPLNWIAVYRVYQAVSNGMMEEDAAYMDTSWRLEGGSILSAFATIYMWGTEQVTDTGRFSPMFVQCLAARIAADAAIPLTENRLLQADMFALYNAKMDLAATRDGMQGKMDRARALMLNRAR